MCNSNCLLYLGLLLLPRVISQRQNAQRNMHCAVGVDHRRHVLELMHQRTREIQQLPSYHILQDQRHSFYVLFTTVHKETFFSMYLTFTAVLSLYCILCVYFYIYVCVCIFCVYVFNIQYGHNTSVNVKNTLKKKKIYIYVHTSI